MMFLCIKSFFWIDSGSLFRLVSFMDGVLVGFSSTQLQEGLDGGFFSPLQQQIAMKRLAEPESAGDSLATGSINRNDKKSLSPARRGRPFKMAKSAEKRIKETPTPAPLKRPSPEKYSSEEHH
jgi:hypothetical protein